MRKNNLALSDRSYLEERLKNYERNIPKAIILDDYGMKEAYESFTGKSYQQKEGYERAKLEELMDDERIDGMQKLLLLRNEAMQGKKLTKDQYERLRGLGKKLYDQYNTGSHSRLIRKDKNRWQYTIDTFSDLDFYLRSEHKRLQAEIYNNTSLDKVLENKNRDYFDVRGKLDDINSYLDVATEKNALRDSIKLREIQKAYNEFFQGNLMRRVANSPLHGVSWEEIEKTAERVRKYGNVIKQKLAEEESTRVESMRVKTQDKPGNVIPFKKESKKIFGKVKSFAKAAGFVLAVGAGMILGAKKAEAPTINDYPYNPIYQKVQEDSVPKQQNNEGETRELKTKKAYNPISKRVFMEEIKPHQSF